MPEDFPSDVPETVDRKTRLLADKYLHTRAKRQSIEFDTQSPLETFPTRLIEIMRGRRFARRLGVTFENRADFDDRLPELAREIAGDAGDLYQ